MFMVVRLCLPKMLTPLVVPTDRVVTVTCIVALVVLTDSVCSVYWVTA